ncbi:hypothetical protein [Streptomyces sp. NPDC001889]
MSVHTPTPSRGTGGAGHRLPWWALALPVLAFAVLMLGIAGPARAETTATGGEPVVRVAIEYLRALLTR